MQIRELKWQEVSMWPPEWSVSDQGAGEEGFLEEVKLLDEQTPECIYVMANHLGDIRKGIIVLENLASLKILYQKLKENLGRPIKEIGDLEIDLFPLEKLGQKRVQPQQKLLEIKAVNL